MAKISEQSIEKIRNRADVVEIISKYVSLKKRGRNYFGLCPFHNEKTPSFSVNPEKQIFKCFGCGTGGSSIDFIMEFEKLDFIESVKYLAEQYNIEIEQSSYSNKIKDISADLYDMNTKVSDLYQNNLLNNNSILTHLLDRGLSKNIIEKFSVGLSYIEKDKVLKMLQGNYGSKSMLESGLFINVKTGYMDRFRNRIMFSLFNITGKVIGFAGRAIDKNEKAKYINSPETKVYNKSKLLYGLHETKNEISSQDSAIVVEGYIDFLQLYQNGIKNVVAVSGTSLTDGHAHILRRLTENIFIAYDGDKAGKSASIRAGFILLKNGLNPKIIQIPNNIDPDEWILKSGVKPFLNAVEESIPLIDFCFIEFEKSPKKDNVVTFINEILNELSVIRDEVLVEINLKKLSEITNISFDSIKKKYNGIQKKIDERFAFQEKRKLKLSTDNISIEDDLIRLCFSKDNDIRHEIYNTLDSSWLMNPQIKKIYEQIYIHLNSEYEPDSTVILDQLQQPDQKEAHHRLVELIFEIERIHPTLEMARDSITRIKYIWLKQNLEKLRLKLKDNENNFQDSTKLINQITEIQSQMNSIKGRS